MCGRKTRADFVDAAFRVKKRRRDVTATYDGYVIVSQRLVDFGLAHACELDGLVELPGDRGFYWFRPSRTLAFAATTSNPCPTCHAFYNVIGPQPVFCQELRGPLAPGFYRSDLEFGSGPEQGPVIVVGAETGEEMNRFLIVEFDDSSNALQFKRRFAYLVFVSHDQAQTRLGASVDANDVVPAAKRGDVSAGFARSVRIA